jgi:DNA-binding HxlR family transcriptional regulator
MLLFKGMVEILQIAEADGSRSFNDFTRISIAGRRLSSATVSKRLNELVSSGSMIETVSKSRTGRRVIEYETTAKGRRVLKLAGSLEDSLSSPKR